MSTQSLSSFFVHALRSLLDQTLRMLAPLAVLLIGSLPLANPAAAQPPALGWTQAATISPSSRFGHAMAYDSRRGVTVLFGGAVNAGSTASNETWEWNGTVWSKRNVTGPSGRYYHAMVYDTNRGVTVLFGGSPGGISADTWEWDGAVWTLRSTAGPSPRYWHAMAYDSVRSVTVLFGGQGGTLGVPVNDCWEWNGSSWTQRFVTRPASRYGHAMTFDPVRGVTVLYGGNGYAETWEYNGSEWSQRSGGFGGPAVYHSLAYDTVRNRVLSYGGGLHDIFSWDGTSWTRITARGPVVRNYASMVFDSARGVAVMFGGLGGTAGSDTWEWDGTAWGQRVDEVPTPRHLHATVYDSVRGVHVLFGGMLVEGQSGETWEWNGTRWRQRRVTGPSPRWGHAMSFDSARGVTVLFGGNSVTGISDETWEWDGSAWTRRTVSAPPARFYHSMVYDPVRAVTTLFGGNGTIDYGDTWDWNGVSWTRRNTTGPGPRRAHATTWDSARNVLVLVGGYTPQGSVGDTWEWDGVQWRNLANSGPSPRSSVGLAFDPVRGVSVLTGGVADSRTSNEVWEWNGTQWTQRPTSLSLATYGHTLTFDVSKQCLTQIGGNANNVFLSELTEWSGSVWRNPLASTPGNRQYHAMAFDSIRGVTVLFSGSSSTNGTLFYADTWEFDGTRWTQRDASGPAPRQYATMAFDSARGVTVLYGGILRNGTRSAETWEWNGSSWTQRVVSGPGARDRHAMAFDSVRNVTVLFSGYRDGGWNSDTWEWNGTEWTYRTNSGPSPRIGHAMTFDSARGVTLMLGGSVSGTPNSEAWEWNGQTWSQRTGSAMPARSYHAMAYDPNRNRSVVFAGTGVGAATWEGDGASWTQLAAPGPSNRAYHAMVYDTIRRAFVMYGGNTGGNETWLLRTPPPCANPAISAQPSPVAGCVGSTVTLSVTASVSDSSPLTYQWRRNGSALALAGNASATTATLTLSNLSAFDAESYDCVVTSSCASIVSTAAAVTVRQPLLPLISSANSSICAGSAVALSVSVPNNASVGPVTYSWTRNGSPITATGPTVAFTAVTVADDGTYICTATTACGSATSSPITLTVTPPPAITAQPVGATVCPGTTYTFSLTATNATGYQWRRNGDNIPGANGPSYTISPVTTATAGSFDVLVTGQCGSVLSTPVTLAPLPGTFLSTPASITANLGQSVTFSTTITGSFTSVSWQRNGVPLANNSFISGATTTTLTINRLIYADGGNYTATAITPCGQSVSAPGVLTLNPGTEILYVDADADAANPQDGRTWGTAFRDLQAALNTARNGPMPNGARRELWVARGTYRPGLPVGGTAQSFVMVDRTALYGGFRANETQRIQRTPATSPTILTADLAGDDSYTIPANRLGATRNENARRTVRIDPGATNVTIDGFTLQGAWGSTAAAPGAAIAVSAGPTTISGNRFANNDSFSGAAITADVGDVLISGNTFFANWANTEAGAILLTGSGSPVLVSNTFQANLATSRGGAISIGGELNAALVSNTFLGNRADQDEGGALLIRSSATVEVANCLFSGNTASSPAGIGSKRAGAAALRDSATAAFRNCTFSGNEALNAPGTLFAGPGTTLSLYNSIIWGRTPEGDGSAATSRINGSGTITLANSVIEGFDGTPGTATNVFSSPPLFVNPAGPDNLWGNADDNCRISRFSAAIDLGDVTQLSLDRGDLDGDGLTDEEIPFDLDRENRRIDDIGIPDLMFAQDPAPDAGCYEFSGSSCLADLAGGGITGLSPDGTVDGTDFIAFINSFAIGDASADPLADVAGAGPSGLAPDGTIDGSDFIAFINAFASGC